ncbi:S-layer homology domain-containing protein [Cohnella soli]|uniref:S-layer homology domain-containing protein n=1 Tax=Cohnella soli TaxID=425005 RepID=A0ABW0I3C6_9BACL
MRAMTLRRKTAAVALAALLALPGAIGAGPGKAEATVTGPKYEFVKSAQLADVRDIDSNDGDHFYIADRGNGRIVERHIFGSSDSWQPPEGVSIQPYAIAVHDVDSIYFASDNRVWEMYSGEWDYEFRQLPQPFGDLRDLVAVSNGYSLLATDAKDNAIYAYTPDAETGSEWEKISTYKDETTDKPFVSPTAIAKDSGGNLYVVNNGNEILKLDSSFNLQESWAAPSGSSEIVGIDADENEGFYLSDEATGLVYHYNSDDRNYISADGFVGAENKLGKPGGIVYENNTLYVADSDRYRLLLFNEDLGERDLWDLYDIYGDYFEPDHLTTDEGGNVYVADPGRHEIAKYNGALEKLGAMGSADGNPDHFNPSAIVYDRGSLYIGNGDVVFKASAATGEAAIFYAFTDEDDMPYIGSLAVDNDGNVYIGDIGDGKIVKVSPSGVKLTDWEGEPNYNMPEMFIPLSIAVDQDAQLLYVSGPDNIQTFLLDGTPVESDWGEFGGTSHGDLNSVAIDADGNVYVAENGSGSGGNRIRKYDSQGNAIVAWGTDGTEDGKFASLNRIAVDSDGNVFASDSDNRRVSKFAPVSASLSSNTASFDKNPANQANIESTITANGNMLVSIRKGGAKLQAGVDYTVAGNVVAFHKTYLSTLSTGTANLEFVFNNGRHQKLAVTITDTSSTVVTTPGVPAAPTTTTAPTNDPNHAAKVDVRQTKNAEGRTTDIYTMLGSNIADLAKNAASANRTVVRIDLDGMSGGSSGGGKIVNVPKEGVAALNDNNVGLEIVVGGAVIKLSKETLKLLKAEGQDLSFKLKPVDSAATGSNALNSGEVKEAAPGGNAAAAGISYDIEPNYSGKETKLELPLAGLKLPANPVLRKWYISQLAMYIAHSDGSKELQKGTIRYDAQSNPVAIEITVTKFSTFTPVTLNEPIILASYVAPASDGLFHPNRPLTRAELAAWLARNIGEDGKTDAETVSAAVFPDVPGSHWAAAPIAAVKQAGLMVGDSQGRFRPNAPVTRAELAKIIASYKGLKPSGAASTFTDVAAGYWAATDIAAVQASGYLVGFGDGTFRPNGQLTRAEAVKALNKLFDRPIPTKAGTVSTWKDVPTTHWASADIEAASHELTLSLQP